MRSLTTIAPAAALLLLAACGTEADTKDDHEHESVVPAGVEKQYRVLAEEVADRGGSVTKDGWTINYIVEAAEPWFEGSSEHAGHFRAPAEGETNHIEIIPQEAETGRIVPDVPITLEVIDADGKVVQSQQLNFYYSTFFHYANNFSLPAEGTYTLRATLGAPTFNRHGDQADGPALPEGVTVEFANVDITF